MRKKVSYVGVVDQGRSVGFTKKKIDKDPVRSGMVRIMVQVRCVRTRLMVYADEDLAGYRIGDFIRRDQRKNFDNYKCNEGLKTVVFSKKED